MANIIDAIINLIKSPQFELKEYSDGHNRANNMGGALEEYVKDLFSNSVSEKDLSKRNKKYQKLLVI